MNAASQPSEVPEHARTAPASPSAAQSGYGSTPVRPSPSRRALDILVSAIALLVALPFVLVVAMAVWSTSRGPVLFRQPRVGEGGRVFTLYKFRSMRADTGGPGVTARGDPRITAVGRFIRSTSLDELPQILNVLLGHMTLVGPRPESPGLAERYPPDCRWVFAYRPGLTGPVQIRLRDNVTLPDDVPDPEDYYLSILVPLRVSTDKKFLDRPTLGRTVLFILATAWYLLAPKSYRPFGAHRKKSAPEPERLRTGH